MKWIIYIITHGPIVDDYYNCDPGFSPGNLVFFNVSDQPLTSDKYKVINKSEVPGFIHLGKYYTEAEVVYNVFKNKLYEEYDFVGFMHWDFEWKSSDNSIDCKVTNEIEKLIREGALDQKGFVSFSGINFLDDYNQTILMDENKPNTLTGKGRNCYDVIIPEYNELCDKDVSIQSLSGKYINMCSAFFCSRDNFIELMKFYVPIIEKGYIDKFDLNHKYRFQGGMMERYVGIFFQDYDLISIPLAHHMAKNSKYYLRWLKYIVYENVLKYFLRKGRRYIKN